MDITVEINSNFTFTFSFGSGREDYLHTRIVNAGQETVLCNQLHIDWNLAVGEISRTIDDERNQVPKEEIIAAIAQEIAVKVFIVYIIPYKVNLDFFKAQEIFNKLGAEICSKLSREHQLSLKLIENLKKQEELFALQRQKTTDNAMFSLPVARVGASLERIANTL